MPINLDEAHCRYLGKPDFGTGYKFASFVKDLGIAVPRELGVDQLAELGWCRPRLRVLLPTEFFLSWRNFPFYGQDWDLATELHWALHVWNWCAVAVPPSAGDPRTLSGPWYIHALDVAEHPITREVAGHLLPEGDPLPEPITHPRRHLPFGQWVDFYRYWQVYEMAELISASSLATIRSGVDIPSQLKWCENNLDQLLEINGAHIRRVQKSWRDREETFDWLSRYRTLLGIWATTRGLSPSADWREVEEAAQALFQELNLTIDQLKASINEHLLGLWRSWAGPRTTQFQKSPFPGVLQLIQQDISRALMFLTAVSGKPIDPEDPAWTRPSSGDRRSFSLLVEALPYEAFESRTRFPTLASMYLGDLLTHVSPKRRPQYEEEGLAAIVRKAWPQSSPFRRFLVSFHRLHDHYGGRVNEDNIVGLREETPVEFLNLCALTVEALLTERLGPKSPKTFHKRVREAGKRIAKSLGVPGACGFSQQLKDLLDQHGFLHDLARTKSDPFISSSSTGHPDPAAAFLLKCLVNFAILRNYAAHHDCIDDELFRYGWVGAGVEGLTVVVVTSFSI